MMEPRNRQKKHALGAVYAVSGDRIVKEAGYEMAHRFPVDGPHEHILLFQKIITLLKVPIETNGRSQVLTLEREVEMICTS